LEDRVPEIESRRLRALREQAATYGPHTDPSVLIEIQDLGRRNKRRMPNDRRQLVNNLDYEFLMDVVAAALVRLGAVEKLLHRRELIRDLWMIVITIIVFLTLIMQLVKR
jgi:hypothetical protein